MKKMKRITLAISFLMVTSCFTGEQKTAMDRLKLFFHTPLKLFMLGAVTAAQTMNATCENDSLGKYACTGIQNAPVNNKCTGRAENQMGSCYGSYSIDDNGYKCEGTFILESSLVCYGQFGQIKKFGEKDFICHGHLTDDAGSLCDGIYAGGVDLGVCAPKSSLEDV